jgi:hypothetical protein
VGWMCMVDGDICESCMQSEVWSVIVVGWGHSKRSWGVMVDSIFGVVRFRDER